MRSWFGAVLAMVLASGCGTKDVEEGTALASPTGLPVAAPGATGVTIPENGPPPGSSFKIPSAKDPDLPIPMPIPDPFDPELRDVDAGKAKPKKPTGTVL